MIHSHKNSIVLLASVLILLAQFASVVHATDHSFHQEDVLCMAFQHAEHNKLFITAASLTVVNKVVISEAVSGLDGDCLTVRRSHYSSRAPPRFAA